MQCQFPRLTGGSEGWGYRAESLHLGLDHFLRLRPRKEVKVQRSPQCCGKTSPEVGLAAGSRSGVRVSLCFSMLEFRWAQIPKTYTHTNKYTHMCTYIKTITAEHNMQK